MSKKEQEIFAVLSADAVAGTTTANTTTFGFI